MTEAFTLYKLILLYVLETAQEPLTGARLCDLMVEKEYTNYFNVQQLLSEMADAGLVSPEKYRNSFLYTITDEGLKTIDFFRHNISPEIRGEIDAYLQEHDCELLERHSYPAIYDRNEFQEYTVDCRIREKGHDLLHLSLSVPTEEAAMAICRKWREKSSEAYSLLMETLL